MYGSLVARGILCGTLAALAGLTEPSADAQFFRVPGTQTSSSSCRVHLVPADHQDDTVAACNSRLARPGDAWLETDSGITPFRTSISGGRNAVYELPVVPAGTAAPHCAVDVRSIELWHLQSHRWENSTARAFHRLVRGGTTRMPEGPAVAIARDVEGHVAAISKPVSVRGGATTQVNCTTPDRGADLLVLLDRTAASAAERPEQLLLDGHHPDISMVAADYLLAIWYGAASGTRDLTFESDRNWLKPLRANLREHGAEVLHAAIKPLPAIRVNVTAPAGAADNVALSLRVEDQSRTLVRSTPIQAGKEAVLTAMPAVPLNVILSVAGMQLRRAVDLSSGMDTPVTFDLQPIVIEGTVTYGGKPAVADISLAPFETKSEENGAYRIVLWQSTRYALRVRLSEHPEIPPYLDTFRFDRSQTLDIEIPLTSYTVQASDESGKPVRDAKINFANEFNDVQTGRRRVVSTVVTGDDGRAILPPLRPGALQLRVDADGYLPAEKQDTVVENAEVVTAITLRRVQDARSIHMTLPNGLPATGAEVLVLSPSEQVLQLGTADEQGTVRVPSNVGLVLLVVRHPGAGSSLRSLDDHDISEIDWHLPESAPPLHVRAVTADGHIAGSEPIYLWIGNQRVSGLALAFLARSGVATAGDGTWNATNLPAGPLRILVVTRASGGAGPKASAFDVLAQSLSFPWPATVEVRAY